MLAQWVWIHTSVLLVHIHSLPDPSVCEKPKWLPPRHRHWHGRGQLSQQRPVRRSWSGQPTFLGPVWCCAQSLRPVRGAEKGSSPVWTHLPGGRDSGPSRVTPGWLARPSSCPHLQGGPLTPSLGTFPLIFTPWAQRIQSCILSLRRYFLSTYCVPAHCPCLPLLAR